MENSASNANCISTKNFEETRSTCSACKAIEIFMSSDTEDITDKLFGTNLQKFQKAIEISNERGSEFIRKNVGLLYYYYFQKIDIKRAESDIKSHQWLINKGVTINSKNEKNSKCFQYAITLALNYEKINKKICKKY